MKAKRRNIRWVVILACCTAATLLYSSHLYVYHRIQGDPEPWIISLAESAADWYSWALLAPAILFMAERFSLRPPRLVRSMLVHLAAGLFFSLLQVAVHTVLDQVLIHGHAQIEILSNAGAHLFARTYHFGLLIYWIVVVVHQAVAFYQDQILRASRLEAQLAQAELQSLRMQLQPHFLFNTLNAISALIPEDPSSADRMLARLSELLRLSLAGSHLQEVPLRQEMEFLERYLEIEKIRFQDRLSVDIRIDPQALEARVPSLILQPLVENSIRHGIAARRGPGRIEIRGSLQEDQLLLQIADNGKGLPEAPIREGVGLANTRARLEQLYGTHHSLRLNNRVEGGTEVVLSLPFHPQQPAAGEA